ncbi:hypothetical protein ACTHQF_06650 [Pedobacter sp. SAFR-022]|uniref:hypothetical protein n=1 Tax=Pedobacter sp. SAFR-022 TaxID=3436861 RepID=UPI003F81F776
MGVFDFKKTYAGTIFINNNKLSCTISFPEGSIILSIITENGEYGFPYEVVASITGLLSTEKGIMKFKAFENFTISTSGGWNQFAHHEFKVQDLLVTDIDGDLNLNAFRHCRVYYDRLESIGRYIDIEHNGNAFSFQPTFERIDFYEEIDGTVSLFNPVTFRWSKSSNRVFSVQVEPYFDLLLSETKSLDLIAPEIKSVGWFVQLIFGAKQLPIDLLLFAEDKANKPDKDRTYFFFTKELVEWKLKTKTPKVDQCFISIEDIKEQVKHSYLIWKSFTSAQKKILTLYFNEINSSQYISDDRFKNLCSLVQGLAAFKTTIDIPGINGDMNKKLRYSCVPMLELILLDVFEHKVLFKLFEIIGRQRDHFQHLNVKLKYDLDDDPSEFRAVNGLLTCIIKFHILKAIEFPDGKIRDIVKRDLMYITEACRSLQKNIKQRYLI